ncbi:MAG: hypothetical protein AABY22_12755 [Nanoarchaeota archaeon]
MAKNIKEHMIDDYWDKNDKQFQQIKKYKSSILKMCEDLISIRTRSDVTSSDPRVVARIEWLQYRIDNWAPSKHQDYEKGDEAAKSLATAIIEEILNAKNPAKE